MSFDYNPFKHVELVQSDEDEEMWCAHCHSCGANLKPHHEGNSLDVWLRNIKAHLTVSHERDEEDFATWSKY